MKRQPRKTYSYPDAETAPECVMRPQDVPPTCYRGYTISAQGHYGYLLQDAEGVTWGEQELDYIGLGKAKAKGHGYGAYIDAVHIKSWLDFIHRAKLFVDSRHP